MNPDIVSGTVLQGIGLNKIINEEISQGGACGLALAARARDWDLVAGGAEI